jgi:hypothetical protein
MDTKSRTLGISWNTQDISDVSPSARKELIRGFWKKNIDFTLLFFILVTASVVW